ncbi:dihydroxyacetone kinase [Tricladium varicosporioides]|nr:dihydroxyacetone kinase [Hymenoscyphus varicosporioides]
MSTKHYFPETSVNTLVPRALKSLVTANPFLSLIESERVVFNKEHDRTCVSIISGGGSGHEPSWSGFVGDRLLSAVACGDIFASPSMKQVMTAVVSAPSDEGVILMITNYTGDRLHFGLAAERALAAGISKKITVLPATDDVSIGRSRSGIVGRRGMPGHILTLKIVGGAASKKYSFERCVELGRAVNAQLVSIGSALDHCHVPGRQNHESIPSDVCVVGAGIHNEPGAKKISPFPSVEQLIEQLLQLLCDQNDEERAFVKFDSGDEVALLVNNYGGLSNLELGALTDETLTQLAQSWAIVPIKIYTGTFESSLNGPGFSISLCNLTKAASGSSSTLQELIDLLDAPTNAPAWPNVPALATNGPLKEALYSNGISKKPDILASEDLKINQNLLNKILRASCEKAIAAEPNLTKWDMVMGDGDCGEAVSGACTTILSLLSSPSNITLGGSILSVLYSIIDAVDDMGGTLGAIFGIFLSSLLTSLRSSSPNSSNPTSEIFAAAVHAASTTLKQYTGAREGDRTVMDVLLPFSDSFYESKDFGKAVKIAREKAEATRFLKPKFGRASYVGEGGKEQELPDPGAWALMEILEGLKEGMD